MASVAAKINFRISLTNRPVLIVIYTLSDSKPHRFDNDSRLLIPNAETFSDPADNASNVSFDTTSAPF